MDVNAVADNAPDVWKGQVKFSSSAFSLIRPCNITKTIRQDERETTHSC